MLRIKYGSLGMDLISLLYQVKGGLQYKRSITLRWLQALKIVLSKYGLAIAVFFLSDIWEVFAGCYIFSSTNFFWINIFNLHLSGADLCSVRDAIFLWCLIHRFIYTHENVLIKELWNYNKSEWRIYWYKKRF